MLVLMVGCDVCSEPRVGGGSAVPTVHISHSGGANDRLDINTLAGSDTVDSAGTAPGVIQLFVDGARQ